MAQKIGTDIEGAAPPPKKSKGAPDPQHGSNLTRETFLESVQEMNAANSKLEKVKEERKALRKMIKARGIELGILDATIKMSEWGRGEVRAKFDTERKYAEWLGLPLGHQPDMFADLTDDEISETEWHAKGKTAGLAGRDPIPPEECPGEMHAHFMAGWHEGQTELLKAMGKKAPAPKKDAPPMTEEEKKAAAKADIRAYADSKKGATPEVQGDTVSAGKTRAAAKAKDRKTAKAVKEAKAKVEAADDFEEDPDPREAKAANDADEPALH